MNFVVVDTVDKADVEKKIVNREWKVVEAEKSVDSSTFLFVEVQTLVIVFRKGQRSERVWYRVSFKKPLQISDFPL